MKTFLISTAILATFLGCSHNNAFDRFEMSLDREMSEENIHSSQVMHEQTIGGVVSAVYLNRIYPTLYKDAEYFYVYLNIDDDVNATIFTLNEMPSLMVEELESRNEFTKLTLFDANWKRYYLVGFKKSQSKGSLELVIKNGEFSSSILKFKKN